jgi:hypothetical protein
MRRNGRTDLQSSECYTSSGLFKGLISLAGGVGIGAGLLYLLDPESGEKRRRQILSGAEHLGEHLSGSASGLLSSVRGYAHDAMEGVRGAASGAASSAADYASDKTSGIRGFAGEKMAGARAALERQVCGETHSERIVGQTICALGSMALGAALMYVLDPSMGRTRRQLAKQTASDYASRAGDTLRSGYDTARHEVSHLAGQAKEKVSHLASQAREKVSHATAGSDAPACPPGMVPNPNLTTGTTNTF